MRMISAAILIISIFQGIFSEELPSDFKKCGSKDSACLKEAISDAFGKLANGIKSLDVPSIDPIHLKKLSISSGKIVQLVQNYEKLDIIGLSTGKVTDFSFDLDKGKMKMQLTAPKLEMKGVYSVKGKLLVLDVYGTGDCLIRFENPKSQVDMDIQKYDKNGDSYIKVTNLVIKVDPEKVYYQFDNLFDGNKALGDNINNVLNDNWKDIYYELQDGYLKAIAADLLKVSNKLFEKVSIKNLFTS